jgi:calcineurin-like phosphoesterase family protein
MPAIPKIWIFTDGHWHQDGTRIDRPVEHTELQFANIKRTVGPDDLVLHCGDVTWRPKTLKEDLDKLPGRWVLAARGNHDSESLTWYMRNGFVFACESLVFRKVLFTHAPANELPGNALLNVHGHLHQNNHRDGSFVGQPWHRLLAIENTRYTPVSFDKFVGNLGSIDLA